MAPNGKRLRCAIYTRKSSEEGLDQAFNSLDAQREACEAYIESQRHEGWKGLAARYDDGGYSGGSMDRPALRALLNALEAGEIDVVVVYKVDRLTRSLPDFAKIVELFDRHKVSFVSVTQQFNTTTSMGRLTLNVLLSFAQFEREVTGERIRDKIAASKKKGMWMGGFVPLGYDLKERKLLVNENEARLVRRIYERYLGLGCVRKLRAELLSDGVRSKVRTSRGGRKSGGVTYSRGALYDILRNRIYIGEIAHRGAVHAGEHQAIVQRQVWDDVQAHLTAGGQARRLGLNARTPSLLAGHIFDSVGNRLTPLHATKGRKRYRYYTSQALIRAGASNASPALRIPASDIENLVVQRLRVLLSSADEILKAANAATTTAQTQQRIVSSAAELASRVANNSTPENRKLAVSIGLRISVHESFVELTFSRAALQDALTGNKGAPPDVITHALSQRKDVSDLYRIELPARFMRKSGAVRMVIAAPIPEGSATEINPVLAKALARGRRWYEMLASGEAESLHAIAKSTGLHVRYVGRVLQCAFLAPNLVEAILNGSQPAGLTLDRLLRGFPSDWQAQASALS